MPTKCLTKSFQCPRLDLLTGKRSKRGPSIIKRISGNFDYTDALKYENAIAIFANLAIELNHLISLNKQWASQSSNVTDRIIESQKKK